MTQQTELPLGIKVTGVIAVGLVAIFLTVATLLKVGSFMNDPQPSPSSTNTSFSPPLNPDSPKSSLPLDIFEVAENGTVQDLMERLEGRSVHLIDKQYGATLLHRAAWHNQNVDVVKYLLSRGADIRAIDREYGATPLHWAVENKNIEVVKYLVSQGANVNAKNKNGETPLDHARRVDNTAMVEFLQYLSSPIVQNSTRRQDQLLPGSFGSNVIEQKADTDTDALRKMKEKDPSYIKNVEEWVKEVAWDNWYPLSSILKYGTQELEKKLKLEETVAKNDAFKRDTALANIKNIKEKISEEQNRIAQKRFYCDVKFGITERGKIVVNGQQTTLNIYVGRDSTGLNISSYFGGRKPEDALIPWKFSFPIFSNNTKFFNFGKAECETITANTDEMKKFCDDVDDDKYVLRAYLTGLRDDGDGGYSSRTKYKVVRFEIRKKEIGDDWKPLDGDPFTQVAENGGAAPIVQNPPQGFNAQEWQAIIDFGKKYVPMYNLGNVEDVKLFVRDVDQTTGRTLLHEAAGDNEITVVKFLLSSGANVNTRGSEKNIYKHTPLHRAAKEGNIEVAKYLVANGADVEIKDRDGNTPFDNAKKAKHVGMQFISPDGAKKFRDSKEGKEYVVPPQ